MNSGSIKNTVNLHGSIVSLGARGYSNYEIAVQNGFEGSEQEWLDSLVGPVGPRGPIGPNNFHVGEEEPEDENVSVWLDTDEPIPNTFVPVATEETLGTIKPGNNLKVDKYGKLEMTIYANNVEEMVNSKLKPHNVVTTLGYYEANDGGGALYLIRKKTENDVEDGGSIHFVGDTLVAELIVNNEINVKQFGAKGDGATDNTKIIQKVIDKYDYIFIPSGTYIISNTITIGNHKNIKGESINNTILKANVNKSFDIVYFNDNEYSIISNLSIDGSINTGSTTDYKVNGINLNYDSSKDGFNKLEYLHIYNCSYCGLLITKQKESIFNNIIINNCGIGLDSHSTDCKFFNITSYWNGTNVVNGETLKGIGIYFEQNSNSNKIVNCKSHSNHSHGFYCRGSYDNFTNCEAQDNWEHGIYLYNCSNNNFNNITSSTNSSSSETKDDGNDYNEIKMSGAKNCYIQGTTVTRDISWSEYHAKHQLYIDSNCINNSIDINYTINPNKLSNPCYFVLKNCYNDVKINGLNYGVENILNKFLLSDRINGNGISDIFDSKNVDTNDGTLEINFEKGCQTINYANAQKKSPNGWLGLSKTISSGFQVGGYVNAIAEFLNNNESELVCVVEAKYYNSENVELKKDRQFSGNTNCFFNKQIPENTVSIKVSFLVLSNVEGANGTVDLYNFKCGISN